MTSFAIADVLVAGVACAAAMLISIRLNRSLTVPIAAALAPTAAALALASEGPWWLVLVAPVLGTLALSFARRPAVQVVALSAGSLVVVGAMAMVHRAGQPSIYVVLAAAASATALFAHAELLGRVIAGHRELLQGATTMWLLLQGVLISASGLLVLVMGRLGWGAFVAMAVVLALTKREFEGFALSRQALDQTVAALEQLAALEEENAATNRLA